MGYQLGGSSCAPVGGLPLAGGVDFNIIQEPKSGETYYGVTKSLGIGVPGAELHVEWGETGTLKRTQFNIFNSIDQLCIKIMEW